MKTNQVRVIVLCAGEGKRLRPLSEQLPKCMVPYQGKPLLSYQLDVFKQFEINDITLLGGHCYEKLPSDHGIVRNVRYNETNMLYSLFCAGDRMQNDKDLIVSYGDIIYTPSVLEALLSANDPISIITDLQWQRYWQQRMEDPLKDVETFKWNAETRRITELGKKPKSLSDIQGQYIGFFKISKNHISGFKNAYKNFCSAIKTHENAYVTDFLQWLIEQNNPLYGTPIQNQWAEFDTLEDLQIVKI